ncbi:MAG: 2-succinyl-5-enolpyruvyl-6-hydroxy-3-cyclohexene-1-carboxylic-acid synthase [Opitutaceae bacterium]|nr:2-succinyl-5-enolpyruvyl-6-hydroxy-3-cyclohexene-1-carboxylic-acid synthase [Opitutaceae bacterium]
MSAVVPLDDRNTNSLWSGVLVETLHRLGLRHAVISPGSRSTPLTMALARHGAIAALPVLDERTAAFFALGLARQQRRPTLLVCTSGTAGANYFPAVIEARESGVPLLVITADRPPEMRECRSGQTIDQQKLFGAHVNYYHEYAVPEASLATLRYLRQTTAHAWERTLRPGPGPVHLNAPFRDPLPPLPDDRASRLASKLDTRRFFSALRPVPEGSAAADGPLRLGGRGIIVAGQSRVSDPAAYARAVGRLSRRLGWPVLADALSPLRSHAAQVPNLVTTYDLIARTARLREELRPERILCLEDWPTSKALRQWLERDDAEVIFAGPGLRNPDALHLRTRWWRGDIARLPDRVLAGRRPAGWASRWREADRAAARRLAAELARSPADFEGRVAALLAEVLPRGTPLVVANSMPVRDLEYFWRPHHRGQVIHCNRGANGIDGTLSTALGIAHGQRPAVLLTGDLALLHDTNGFLLRPKFQGSLTIVLINNHGGGIFGHLPVAQFEPPFEEFFATPQEADFRGLARAYGVKHHRVASPSHLARLLRTLPARGIRILEVRTDRRRDAAQRQTMFAGVAARLERLARG